MNWKKVALASGALVALVAAYVLSQDPAVVAWMNVASWKGAPRWAWLALGGIGLGDYVLLRLNNPRARAVAEILPNVIALLLSRFPGLQGVGMWIAKNLGSPPPATSTSTSKPDNAGPIKLDGLLPLLLIPALLSLGCAGGLNGVRESLTVSAKLLQASADTFKAADLDYQRALEKKPDAAYEINKYRTEVRPKVMKAFVDAAAALSLAQATCAAVEQGAKSKNDLGAVMVQAFAELKAVQDALAAIGILPPRSSTRWRWRPRATRLARVALELALPEFVRSQAVL